MIKLTRLFLIVMTIAVVSSAALAQGQPSFTTVRGIPYGVIDGSTLLMDIDIPRNQGPGPFPALLSIHGGGWFTGTRNGTVGTKEVYRGYVIARLDYRLSGTWKFPAQIHDCKGAIRFLRKHAAQYKIDPTRIGAFGDSSGGHLAALLGTSGGISYLEGPIGGNYAYSSRVQAVIEVSGPTDFLQISSHPSVGCGPRPVENPQSFYSRFIGGGLNTMPEQVARANPATYATPDDPPFFIVHGTSDCLVPFHQSQILVDALTAQGVNVTFIPLAGLGHGLNPYNNLAIRQQMRDFLDRHLKGIGAGK